MSVIAQADTNEGLQPGDLNFIIENLKHIMRMSISFHDALYPWRMRRDRRYMYNRVKKRLENQLDVRSFGQVQSDVH